MESSTTDVNESEETVDFKNGRRGPRTRFDEDLASGNRVRVLVVDDEPSICTAMTIALNRAGYDCISAESGDAALAIIRGQRVDIMLIDLRMREMRGDEAFVHAAAMQPHLRHRTLFMTGDITETAEQVIADCNCGFLRKPFELHKMLAAVARLDPMVRDATA